MGELVGAGVQLGVGEGHVILHHRGGVGRDRHPGLELGQQVGRVHPRPLGQTAPRIQPGQFFRAKQRQLRDGEIGRGGGRIQQADEMPHHPLDSRLNEQVCVIIDVAGNGLSRVFQGESHIEFGGAVVNT